MAIDQHGAQPLSAQIRDDLAGRIQAGAWQVGEKIPSLKALSAEYGVAELTVHAAIRELQYTGVLESASGRGTFVKSVPAETTTPQAGYERLSAEIAELRERVEALERGRESG